MDIREVLSTLENLDDKKIRLQKQEQSWKKKKNNYWREEGFI